MRRRLAIVCTHPIQYFAPVFCALSEQRDLQVRVFYGWKGAVEKTLDHGFGQKFAWDIPLLDGYEFEFVPNVARDPGTHHFRGIDLPALRERIKAWKPDALVVYGWRYKAHLAAMRYFHGKIPILFRGDSTLLNERPGWRRWARRRALRWVYRHVDRALYVGQQNRRYFKAHGLRDDQLVFAPHSVDNDRFSTSEHSGESCDRRGELNIARDAIVILFVGKLEPTKAPELLLRAFRALGNDALRLVFVGAGPLEDELRTWADGRVTFLGLRNQSEMPGMYRLADCVVLPSRGETWGLALNEAMACGRAIAASDRVGAAVDLVQPGRNGWIFAANDVKAIKECLSEAAVLGRSGLRKLGEQSRRIIADWSISRQVQGILRAIESCD
jgi:glycosyltransferase involved in cell wall biosynthesis